MPSRTAARHDVRWVGLSAEDRRAARRTLLLDAAFDLLGNEGSAGTSVRAVCQSARLNPRYFYESFDDLDALIVAVYDRTIAELAAAFEGARQGAADDATAQVRAAVDAIVSFVDDDRRRARVLYIEALGNEALNRRRMAAGQALVTAVAQQAPTGDAISRMAAAMLVGGLSEMLLEWLEGRIRISRRAFVDNVTALALGVGEAAAKQRR